MQRDGDPDEQLKCPMCRQGMGGDDVIDLETFIENHERDTE